MNTGRATGECFVVLESQEDVDNAKNFHKTNLGSRTYGYIFLKQK